METQEKTVKVEIEIPEKAYRFVEKYASLSNNDVKTIIERAAVTELATIREKVKQLPFVRSDTFKDPWQIN